MNVKKLWSPAATLNNIDKFKDQLGKNKNISSYNDLHEWSAVSYTHLTLPTTPYV